MKSAVSDSFEPQDRSRRAKSDPKRTRTSSLLQRSSASTGSPQNSANDDNQSKSYGFDSLSLDSSTPSDVDTSLTRTSPSEAGELRAPNCPRVSHKYRQKTTASASDVGLSSSTEDSTRASTSSSGSSRENAPLLRVVSNSRKTAAAPPRVLTTGRGLSILTPKSKRTKSRMDTDTGRAREHHSKTPLKNRGDVNTIDSANDDPRERWRGSSAWQAQRSMRAASDDTVSIRFASPRHTPRHSAKRSNSDHDVLSRDRDINANSVQNPTLTPRRPENRTTSQNTHTLMRSRIKRDSTDNPSQTLFENCDKENALSSNDGFDQLGGRLRNKTPLMPRPATDSAYQRSKPVHIRAEPYVSATPHRFSGHTLKYAAGFSTPGHRLLARDDNKGSRAFGQDITRTVLNHKNTTSRQAHAVVDQLSTRGTHQYRSARRPLQFN